MAAMSSRTLELVVLLDDQRRPAGSMAKADVHAADTPLHLAFSVYVFDAHGQLLVTRRALSKVAWPGVWTNSCCGHPAPDEPLEAAVRRRLMDELLLVPARLDLVLPDFAYRAVSPEGVVEHELCPVFLARVDRDPTPDPCEVAQWQWVDWASFETTARTCAWALSPWAVEQSALLAGLVQPWTNG